MSLRSAAAAVLLTLAAGPSAYADDLAPLGPTTGAMFHSASATLPAAICATDPDCGFAIPPFPDTISVAATETLDGCALDATGDGWADPLSYDLWRKRSLQDHETCISGIFASLGTWPAIASWMRAKDFDADGGIRLTRFRDDPTVGFVAALTGSRARTGLPQIVPSTRVLRNDLHNGPLHVHALLDRNGAFLRVVVTETRRLSVESTPQ
ncbi:hypothetical protein [Jannaschia donghaensis]|nr:hypothetical protein [Jannaschia donghaensis]